MPRPGHRACLLGGVNERIGNPRVASIFQLLSVKLGRICSLSYQFLPVKAFKIVSRWALKNAMYCHLKSYSVLQESRNLLKS